MKYYSRSVKILRNGSAAIWLVALVSATIAMASAIYFIYFYQPRQDGGLAARADQAQKSSAQAVESPIIAIEKPTNLNLAKVQLGAALFHDPRLSRDDTISCASCHDLEKGGTDQIAKSIGVDMQNGDINAPSVYNSALHFRQFWDGRARDLREQAAGPIFNPVEMASNWDEVLPKLAKDNDLVKAFEKIYNEKPNAQNIVDAIATYEESLLTPSRFDRYLQGDRAAITNEEQTGYGLFLRNGCVACHQGEGVGGNLYQKFGTMRDYYSGECNQTHAAAIQNSYYASCAEFKSDLGRFNVTGRDEDRYVFKVPSLRNVALTPPYFHNGSSIVLEDAVAKMGIFQLGVELPPEDVGTIAVFLRSLTGEELEKKIK
ncbi:MAG: cytochrome-c peroxidase [Helicobacteraceae bacterium]|jgi:cytochrome c peroxidase|nr:cytochrome-c peroxidase [Helicobacteraceae bacterium]